MIISKYSKSYDTADGTEQQFRDPQQLSKHDQARIAVMNSAKAAGQRWDDDGGSLPLPPPLCPVEPASKPAWSVLSLIDLNETIRLEYGPDSPLHRRREAKENERQRLREIEVEEARMAEFTHAKQNRYRNHWENT